MLSQFHTMFSANSYTLIEATEKLKHYCAYQERCHQEVVEKLKGMRMIPEAINHIVTHLIQNDYLSETRFAKSFARGKFRIKKWGKNRITKALKQREISTFNIQIALAEIEETAYLNTLDELVRKKWSQISDTPLQKRKKKLINYLLYRGWESHLVYEKIRELT